jgi:cobalt-zinc-cadmium resistance protein CzcA
VQKEKVKSLDDIENIVVKNLNGTYLCNVADVRLVMRIVLPSLVTEKAKVLGQVMMLKGANSKQVINDVLGLKSKKIITRRSLYKWISER